jgi:hypothetical protein
MNFLSSILKFQIIFVSIIILLRKLRFPISLAILVWIQFKTPLQLHHVVTLTVRAVNRDMNQNALNVKKQRLSMFIFEIKI